MRASSVPSVSVRISGCHQGRRNDNPLFFSGVCFVSCCDSIWHNYCMITLHPPTGQTTEHGKGSEPASVAKPDYIAFALVPTFFLLGLLGVVICHVLKRKGYRCTTEAQDDEEECEEEEKDLELGAGKEIWIRGRDLKATLNARKCWNMWHCRFWRCVNIQSTLCFYCIGVQGIHHLYTSHTQDKCPARLIVRAANAPWAAPLSSEE